MSKLVVLLLVLVFLTGAIIVTIKPASAASTKAFNVSGVPMKVRS